MFALSFLIVTTIIGAGFATGAELIAFFGASALPPLVIALLTAVFLLVLMWAAYIASKGAAPDSKFKKLVMNAVYFSFCAAMIAGVRELGGGLLAIFATVLCGSVVFFGFDKMLFINNILAAAIFVVLLWVGFANIGSTAAHSGEMGALSTTGSALLYAGLNTCMMEQLFKTARKRFSRTEIALSAVFAVAIISFFVMLLLTAIRAGGVTDAAMPIIALNGSIVTYLTVFFAIITSLFMSMFAMTGEKKKTKKSVLDLLIIGTAAYICSMFGFTETVSTVYPIIGAGMVIYSVLVISSLFWKLCQRNRVRRNQICCLKKNLSPQLPASSPLSPLLRSE